MKLSLPKNVKIVLDLPNSGITITGTTRADGGGHRLLVNLFKSEFKCFRVDQFVFLQKVIEIAYTCVLQEHYTCFINSTSPSNLTASNAEYLIVPV